MKTMTCKSLGGPCEQKLSAGIDARSMGRPQRELVGLKPTDPASENVRKQIVSGEI
jgi:hypothetical protein